MREHPLKLNIILAAVAGAVCLALSLGGALAPGAIMPRFDLVMMLSISLIALTIDAYWRPRRPRPWFWTAALGTAVFTLLPWCAGVAGGVAPGVLGLSGGAVFTVTAVLYTAAMERIATGPKAPLAPAGTALMMFLAGQCLSGLL